MSAIPTRQWPQRGLPFRHQYDDIRQRSAPAGIACPHCQGTREIFYSSAQLRRPLYKRIAFAYLRCHCCTHRFRRLRLAPLVFWTIAAIAVMFAGVIT